MAAQGLLAFQRVCRTCLTEQKKVPAPLAKYWQNINDFRQPSATETEKVRIVALLKSCVPQLQVRDLGELPQLICPLCLTELDNMHKFQQKCLSSERQLHEHLEQEKNKEAQSKPKEPPVTPANVNDFETDDPLRQAEESADEISSWLKFEVNDKANEELQPADCLEMVLCGSQEQANQALSGNGDSKSDPNRLKKARKRMAESPVKEEILDHNPLNDDDEDMEMATLNPKSDELSGGFPQEPVVPKKMQHIEDVQGNILENQARIQAKLSRIEQTLNAFQDESSNNQHSIMTLLNQFLKKNVKFGNVQEFPLTSPSDMDAMEQKISQDMEKYVEVIKTIITPGGLYPNFTRLFSTDVIISSNYDGVNNKIPFKSYRALNLALFEAVKKDGYIEKDFIQDLRQCFKAQKGRYYKKVFDEKRQKSAVKNLDV